MPILIDGHNLIAHLPDLSLDDPDDEARLVVRLRAYNARTRKRITVVFDHGLPGGWSRELSTGPVEVVFAGSHTNADRVLIERMRAAKNAPGLVVVSSDSQVRREAEARGAHAVSADRFAAGLAAPPPAREARRATDDVHLSPGEVEEWMQMFKAARRRKGGRRPSAGSGGYKT
jgi:predicted RNA-binding protein with PIN domain